MDNKLSELSKPVAHIAECGTIVCDSDPFFDDYKNPKPIYSQEYVSALQHESAVNWEAAASLNVENQELKKRIAELERANQSQDDHINQQQDRIDSLEKTNSGLGQRLGAAEKRLATPVQLQNCDFESVAIMAHWCTDEQLKAWVKGVEHAKKQIRAAGFKVEGDE